MHPLGLFLTALIGVNAMFDLRRNMEDGRERKRRAAFERAGRIRAGKAARQLVREAGRDARVRVGVDDETEDIVLVVERWPRQFKIPEAYEGFPVKAPATGVTRA